MNLILGVMFALVNGFFAASETAYLAANPVRVAHLTRKTKRQEQSLELLDRTELLLITTLVGTNIAVVLAGVFFTAFFVVELGEALGTTVAIVVGAVAGLLLSEYLPKSLARAKAEKMVIATSGFYSVAVKLSKPFKRLFRRPRAKKRDPERLSISRPDMLTAIRLGEKIGSIEEKTSPRVANLFRAFDTPVAEVMTPWDRVVVISEDANRSQILKKVNEHGFTRYPVADKREEKIKGIIHTKDLLSGKIGFRKPFFTRPGNRITDLLRRMQDSREHMVIILDSRDNPLGLATLEDLLEEFVGEIRSEE